MKNRYYIRSRISEKKFREIVKLFIADLTAQQIAFLSKTNRKTVNKILMGIRKQIACFCEKESYFNKGEIEIDESYFGARRIRGRRGRGASGKTIVFGLKKREGRFIHRLLQIVLKKRFCLLYAQKLIKKQLFLQMDLRPMIVWWI